MFRFLPPFGGDQRAVAEIVNGIMNGKTNNTGLVTLATGNATSTTITDARIGIDSTILLIPSSDAAETDAAPYGCFTNNTDQLSPSVGSTAVVIYDTTEEASGIYLSDDSRINVRNYGVYNAQFSLQLVNRDNDPQYADVWFRVNGVDVPRSASRFDLPARRSAIEPSHTVGTVNLCVEMQAGDYLEVAGTTSDTDVGLDIFGDLEEIETTFDSRIWLGGKLQFAGVHNAKIVTFSGANNTAYIETGDIEVPGSTSAITMAKPIVDNGSGNMALLSRRLLNEPTEFGAQVVADAENRVSIRGVGRYHRLQLTPTGNWKTTVGVACC